MTNRFFCATIKQKNQAGRWDRMKKSNIAELMLCEAVESLLALCADKSMQTNTSPSDYDRFLHLCRCLPLFYGHPIKESAKAYLKRYFEIDLPIIPKNAEKLWLLTAERLLVSDCDIPYFSVEQDTTQAPLPPPRYRDKSLPPPPRTWHFLWRRTVLRRTR